MSDRLENELSSQKGSLSQALYRIWHFPDTLRWMAPLPPFHRRWLLFLLIVISILLLLPAPKKVIAPAEDTRVPMQAALVIDGNQSFDRMSTAPVKIINGKPQTENDEQGTWQTLQVQQGQTFTQLLRDHNFPIEDAMALARVEGDDKPLSNLKVGQRLNVKLDDKGKIVALDMETANQQQAFFIRQPDGAFYRYQ